MGCCSVLIKKRHTGLILILLGLTGTWGCTQNDVVNSKEVGYVNKDFRLTFSMPIDRFYRKSLTIDQTGRCEFVVESNIEKSDVPEIGHYASQITPKEASELRDRVVGLGNLALKPEGPFPPGVTMMQVSLDEDDKMEVRTFDPHTVPSRYQVVGRQVSGIEEEARKNVAIGLRFDFFILDKKVDPGSPMGFLLRVTALGEDPVRFYNPLFPGSAGSGEMILLGVRSDVRERDLKISHRQAHFVSEKELRTSKPTLSQDENILVLPPGGTLEMEFGVVLNWPPGNYKVDLQIETSGKEENVWDLVLGKVITAPQLIEVTVEAKP